MEDVQTNCRPFLRNVGAGVNAASAGSGSGSGGTQTTAAAQHQILTQTQDSQSAMTSRQALQLLKDGNDRFLQGKMLKRDYMRQVKETSESQFPFAVIVGCIDSRECAHITFDQGIGDVFSARTAGNFVNDDVLGSLEFACAAAGAKLILVVGHSECGAIKGACDDILLGNLTHTLANLKRAVAAVPGFATNRTSSNPEFVQAVAEKNVELAMIRIRQRSPILRKMAEDGDIGIEGAMYDVRTGRVTFM